MFDISSNDTCAGDNSDLTKRDTGKTMNSLENDLIKCPTLLAGMSHEMRTHMNAIVAFSFLMKENCSRSPENEEYSNQILKSCEQLLGLFDSFLDSAIIDTGNSKADSKICKLDNLLDDLLSEFRDIIMKEGHKEVELISEVQFNNSAEISIDKNRIFRVIRSLFHNSIRNTKSGYVRIGYFFRDEMLTFSILDSGQGYFKCKEFLHSEDLNESLAKHNDTYAAINLTLARKIIQMLGGSIRIECNGLAGTGIYFSVPAQLKTNANVIGNKYVNTMIAI